MAVSQEEANKAVVRRFNERVIVALDEAVYREIFDPSFINHSAAPGTANGAEGMWRNFSEVIHSAFPDLRVEIEDQICEGDKVVTRKVFLGTHLGPLMGISPTGKPVAIHVIDIVRLKDGRYAEHWGVNTLSAVLAQLRG